jgi:hypothetical protein
MSFPSSASPDAAWRSGAISGNTHDVHGVPLSAVSWAAILAGATASAALSLILLMLGVGLGLSSVSPWAANGVSAATVGVSTILWLGLTQVLAAGMGGYLAGRLRSKWISVHTDEVYFRDTVHGFLSWALACLVTAAVLSSAIGSIINGGTATAILSRPAVGAGTGRAEEVGAPMGYWVDGLFRNAGTPAGVAAIPGIGPAASPEVTRIFLNSLRSGPLPAPDLRYVGQLVAQSTGLSQQEAERRVSDAYAAAQTRLIQAQAAAKEAADKARKAAAYTALWMFIALLIGAFSASLAATVGGVRRDA